MVEEELPVDDAVHEDTDVGDLRLVRCGRAEVVVHIDGDVRPDTLLPAEVLLAEGSLRARHEDALERLHLQAEREAVGGEVGAHTDDRVVLVRDVPDGHVQLDGDGGLLVAVALAGLDVRLVRLVAGDVQVLPGAEAQAALALVVGDPAVVHPAHVREGGRHLPVPLRGVQDPRGVRLGVVAGLRVQVEVRPGGRGEVLRVVHSDELDGLADGRGEHVAVPREDAQIDGDLRRGVAGHFDRVVQGVLHTGLGVRLVVHVLDGAGVVADGKGERNGRPGRGDDRVLQDVGRDVVLHGLGHVLQEEVGVRVRGVAADEDLGEDVVGLDVLVGHGLKPRLDGVDAVDGHDLAGLGLEVCKRVGVRVVTAGVALDDAVRDDDLAGGRRSSGGLAGDLQVQVLLHGAEEDVGEDRRGPLASGDGVLPVGDELHGQGRLHDGGEGEVGGVDVRLRVRHLDADLLVSVQQHPANLDLLVGDVVVRARDDGDLAGRLPRALGGELPLDGQEAVVAGVLGDAGMGDDGGVGQMEADLAVGGDDGGAVVRGLEADGRKVGVGLDGHRDDAVRVRGVRDGVPDDLLHAALTFLDGADEGLELGGGELAVGGRAVVVHLVE